MKRIVLYSIGLFYNVVYSQTPYNLNYGTSCDPNAVTSITGDLTTPTLFEASTICTNMQTHPLTTVILKASQEIIINPESAFPVINNTSSHDFRAYIDEQSLEIADMIGNWQPTKYNKMEIGIKIPNALQTQIDDFLAGNQNGLNPYDPDVFRIECDFIVNGATYKRNGFCYKDFIVQNNHWIEQTTNYKHRIRFAPPQVGNYKFNIRIVVNNVATYFFSGIFNVANSSNHGHLTTANTNDTRKFFFEDGTPFFGIGQNLWAGGDNAPDCLDQTYYSCVSPTTYTKLRNWITDLANNGGNFTRLRIDNFQFPIMWPNQQYQVGDPPPDSDLSKYLLNYDNNQKHMWELDQTFDLLEEKEVYAILSLLQDQNYKIHSPYGSPPTANQWLKNPYSALLGTSFQDCKSFFSNTGAQQIFKKYLNYMIARWGYSTSLGGWMMINETINVSDEMDSYTVEPSGQLSNVVWKGPYTNDITFRNQVNQWVCDMKFYMEQQYPWHPTTTGLTETEGTGNNRLPCLNFWSQNDYTSYSEPNNGKYFLRDWYRFAQAKEYFIDYKPFIFGELGMPDNSIDIDIYNDRTFHNANWISVMSGALGTGMYWNDMGQYSGTNHRANFNAIKTFVGNVDWSQPWIPTTQPWDNRFGTTGTNGKQLYTFCSVTPNTRNAIAFSLNKSSHWANDPSSSFGSIPNYMALLQKQGITANQQVYDIDPSYSAGNPKVEIYPIFGGFMPSDIVPYWVDKYVTYGNGSLVSTTLQYANVIYLRFYEDMTFAINPTNGYPDYAYIVRPYPLFRTSDTLVFTNTDTVYMEPSFISNKQDYNYTYDWGNGTISNDSIARVHYNTPGTYTITLTVNNVATDTSAVYNQVVHVSSLADKVNTSQISIYPNPTFNSCFIKYDADIFKQPNIEVYDQLGKLVLSQSLNSNNEINITALNSGMYFVKFYDNNYQKICKLVKQ